MEILTHGLYAARSELNFTVRTWRAPLHRFESYTRTPAGSQHIWVCSQFFARTLMVSKQEVLVLRVYKIISSEFNRNILLFPFRRLLHSLKSYTSAHMISQQKEVPEQVFWRMTFCCLIQQYPYDLTKTLLQSFEFCNRTLVRRLKEELLLPVHKIAWS